MLRRLASSSIRVVASMPSLSRTLVRLSSGCYRDIGLSALQSDVSSMQAIKSPLNEVIESDLGKFIHQTISMAIDSIPALLKVLDAVSKVHPFIECVCSL